MFTLCPGVKRINHALQIPCGDLFLDFAKGAVLSLLCMIFVDKKLSSEQNIKIVAPKCV